MKQVLDASEHVDLVETSSGEAEVWVSAVATYEEATQKLRVQLRSFLRPTSPRGWNKPLDMEWLPKPDLVVECVGPDEKLEAAREIFSAWVNKVREAALVHASPSQNV